MFAPLRLLLPSGRAWRFASTSRIAQLLGGITPAFERAAAFVATAYQDIFPEHTTKLQAWERELGLWTYASTSDDERRLAIGRKAAEWGGSDLSHLESVIRAEGFEVYLHECWETTDPYVARDPRDHIEQPRIGWMQAGEALAQAGESSALANAFLANETHYMQTPRWSSEAPDRVPDDSDYWPFFVYVGGETFGESGVVHPDRVQELRYLLRRAIPARHWIVEMWVEWYMSAFPILRLDSEDGVTLMTTRYWTSGSTWTTTDQAVQYWANLFSGNFDWVDITQVQHATLQSNVDGVVSYNQAANVRPVVDEALDATVLEFKKTIYSGYNRAVLGSSFPTGSFLDEWGAGAPSFDLHIVFCPGTIGDYGVVALNETASQSVFDNGAVSVTVTGHLRIRDDVGSNVMSGVVLTAGEWTSLVISYDSDAGTLTARQNGFVVQAATSIGGNLQITKEMHVGGIAGFETAWFRLALCEVFVGGLSPTQISEIFAMDAARYPSIF